MVARVSTVAFQGLSVQPVDVQVQVTNGLPAFTVVGLADKAVGESRERVRGALHALGLSLPAKHISVNLAPADVAKEGSHYDLPIALGLLAAMEVLPADTITGQVVLGELSLDASLRSVAGVLPAALHAGETGAGLICPGVCGPEAAWAGKDVPILAADHLLQLINHFKGTQVLSAPQINNLALSAANTNAPDMADVKGQETAKRGLEIAAAGGHNLLFSGPPGVGKSMLARCLPGILPPLSPREALEISMIHSLAGTLPEGGLVRQRPYRDPHHSASLPALVGGGHRVKPGEISLAHHGVLFLDEIPEFNRASLEALRQPLESGEAVIARANNHVTYPAKFQLIAAMNPCRCGYLGDPVQECTRAPRCGQDYQSKLSGPFLDRIDIHVEVQPLSVKDMTDAPKGEASADIAARVLAARHIQNARFGQDQTLSNADLKGEALETHCAMETEAKSMIIQAAEKLRLSARAYQRTLRVARTIADLEGDFPTLQTRHIAEALSYRRPFLQ